MALASYSDLQAAVKDWLAEDSLLDARLPDFIAFTEAEMNYGRAAAPGRPPIKGFRTQDMQKREPIALTEDVNQYALPADYLQVMVLDYPDDSITGPLTQLTLTEIDSIREVSELRYYAYSEGGIIIRGTPGEDPGSLSLLYYSKIPALSDTVLTNWVLEKHPDVYLYGTLVHAAAYLKQDPAPWEKLYEQAREGVIVSDNIAQRGPVQRMSMAYSVV